MYAAPGQHRDEAGSAGEERTMGFTPIDIENQKFDVKMRGYDRDQVASFLSAIAEEATRMHAERSVLEEEAASLRRRLHESESRDKKLQETILALREMTEKMKEETRRERELVLREARAEADRIIREARAEGLRIESHMIQLRIDRDNFESRLRLLLDEHQRLLAQRRHDATATGAASILSKRIEAES